MTTTQQIEEDLLYPSGNGKPFAQNTEQYKWITLIKENLEILFASNNDVFVAGHLFWYSVTSLIIDPIAPDVMVVFGRPKGERKVYKQWCENDIPPQVVFDILPPFDDDYEMERKMEFYEVYGVEEYYLYEPELKSIQAWMRSNDKLEQIEQVNGWVSPRLGIKFDISQGELVIYRPDGERFLTSVELWQKLELERQRAEKFAEYLRSQGIDPDNLPDS
jgi:Uma2 family endonuclease